MRNEISFIVLFFLALSPAFSQEAGAPATVNSEQATAPEPAVQPAASEQKAPEPQKADATEPKKSDASVPQKSSVSQPEDKLPWWPTDAQPAPVKDKQRGGFWWWPEKPGTVKDLWGNRGYAYVNKIIYDWRGEGSAGGGVERDVQVKINDIGFPETENKPSLLVKRTVRNHLLQFKVNSIEIKPEHAALLKKAAASLKRNKEASALITVHNDTSGLGVARTKAVEKFLTDQGVAQERIYIVVPEKFQEAGLSSKEEPPPGTVQVLIAEVKEVLIPGPKN